MQIITAPEDALRPFRGGWRAGALKGLTFRGITFSGPVSVSGAVELIFEACVFHGTLDLVRCERVCVRESVFEDVPTGLRSREGEGLIVEDCQFRRVVSDGVVLGGEARFLIQRNRFSDWPRYTGGKHPDAIQTVRPGKGKPCIEGRVLSNLIYAPDCQGIFMPESVDCEIDGNVVATNAFNAIGLANAVRPVLGSNAIMTVAPSDTQAQVNLTRAVDPVFRGVTVALPFGRHGIKVYQ